MALVFDYEQESFELLHEFLRQAAATGIEEQESRGSDGGGSLLHEEVLESGCQPTARLFPPAPANTQQQQQLSEQELYESEGRALRAHVLEQALVSGSVGWRNRIAQLRQRNEYSLLSRIIEEQAVHVFRSKGTTTTPSYSRRHECRGKDETARQKLQKLNKEHQAARIINAEIRAEIETLTKAMTTGCDFEHFDAKQEYCDPRDRRIGVATGDVYICMQSGLIHICVSCLCTHQVQTIRGESLICALTFKFYGQPVTSFEAHADDTREGSVTVFHGKERNFYLRRGSNATRDQTSSYDDHFHRQAGGGSSSGSKSHISSRKQTQLREKRDRIQSQLVNGLGDCILPDPQTPHRSLFESQMMRLHPGDKIPDIPNSQREEMLLVFRRLIFDKLVRASTIEKLVAAERQALEELSATHQPDGAPAQQQQRRDVFLMATELHGYVGVAHRRMLDLGWQDPAFDQKVLDYFFDCITILCKLLFFIGNAKQGTHLFRKYGVGLLYKLQSGITYYVPCNPSTGEILRLSCEEEEEELLLQQETQAIAATSGKRPLDAKGPPAKRPSFGELSQTSSTTVTSWTAKPPAIVGPDGVAIPRGTVPVCFVPRHPFLDRLPTLKELNQFSEFNDIGSCTIVESSRFFNECYKSLLRNPQFTHVQQFRPYTLEPYINLTHHERAVGLLPP